MEAFSTDDGARIVLKMIRAIQESKQYLSDIDGAIGDGDHGINMSKGFTLCEDELARKPGNLSYSLKVLAKVLMMDIGGSMGPLYGMFFRAMAKESEEKAIINGETLGKMMAAAEAGVRDIGGAQVGDKTMLDVLAPAVVAYHAVINRGGMMKQALEAMKEAAIQGRDSTKDMVARVGRASRLGERSRGVIDAGAASCCILLCAIADAILEMTSQEISGGTEEYFLL